MNRWEKLNTAIRPHGQRFRAWCVDLDVEDPSQQITEDDLFDPTLWSGVRTRRLFGSPAAFPTLAPGDIVRVVRQVGYAPFSVELVVIQAIPGGVIMGLFGARNDWQRIAAAEKTAKAERVRAAAQHAETLTAEVS
jgi:hypothetical protein